MTKATIRRALTADRGPPGAAEEITVDLLESSEKLSPRMHLLPNGDLLCKDVPIARVGWMSYLAGEVPVVPGGSPIVYVERTEDDLFAPETIVSFMGAAITDEHPSGGRFVDKGNEEELKKGYVTTNVRRGTGDDADVLLADIVITDRKLIADIRGGKREVSAGYEADYKTQSPGVGRQSRILGNHVALVRKGRCGPRCAIGDGAPERVDQPQQGSNHMTTRNRLKTRRPALDPAALEAARARVADAQAELEELESGTDDEGEIHIHVHQGAAQNASAATGAAQNASAATGAVTLDSLAATVSTLAESVKKLTEAQKTPEEIAAAVTDEVLKKAAGAGVTAATADGDSKALQTSYDKLASQLEILVPGFRIPTFDASLKRAQTVDAMCQARRKCLDIAYATTDGKALLDEIGGDDLDLAKLDCQAVAVLTAAAAKARAATNNRSAVGDGKPGQQAAEQPRPRLSVADIEKANREFWAARDKQGAGS